MYCSKPEDAQSRRDRAMLGDLRPDEWRQRARRFEVAAMQEDDAGWTSLARAIVQTGGLDGQRSDAVEDAESASGAASENRASSSLVGGGEERAVSLCGA
jgi:hypothetical protein